MKTKYKFKFLAYLILILYILMSFNAVYIFAYEDVPLVYNYSEFQEYFKQAVLAQKSSITLKIITYDSNTYSLDRVINDLEISTPEVSFLFSSAKGTTSGYSNTKTKTLTATLTYQNNASLLNKVVVVNNTQELSNAVAQSFANYEPITYVKIFNYSKDKYPIGDIVNTTLNNYPGFGTGYSGVSTTYYGTGDKVILRMKYQYAYPTDEIRAMRETGDAMAQKIVNSLIKPYMSDYDKELILHDYIVNNTTYNNTGLVNNTLTPIDRSVYGCLIRKLAVCEGYALAYKKMLDLCGVESMVVVGNAGGTAHAWSIVNIQGNYYHTDVTWDDPVLPSGKQILSHDFFNVTDSYMRQTHQWDASRYPECNSALFNYKNVKNLVDSNTHIGTPAEGQGLIKLTIGKRLFILNSKSQEIDPGRNTVPVIINGRTLVPIRAIIEAINGTIAWNATTKTVIIKKGNNNINLKIGSKAVTVNGSKRNLDVPAVIIDGRTYVPVRFVSENLGCNVNWNSNTKEVTIIYNR